MHPSDTRKEGLCFTFLSYSGNGNSSMVGSNYIANSHFHIPWKLLSTSPGDRDEKLSRAVNELIPAAFERRQAILVVQRGYGKYTVRVDQEVPCGATLGFSEECMHGLLSNRRRGG